MIAPGAAPSAGRASPLGVVSAVPTVLAPESVATPTQALLALLAENATPFSLAFAAAGDGASAARPVTALAQPPAKGDPRAADSPAAISAPDATMAALAAVLQWLQQQWALPAATAPPTLPGTAATAAADPSAAPAANSPEPLRVIAAAAAAAAMSPNPVAAGAQGAPHATPGTALPGPPDSNGTDAPRTALAAPPAIMPPITLPPGISAALNVAIASAARLVNGAAPGGVPANAQRTRTAPTARAEADTSARPALAADSVATAGVQSRSVVLVSAAVISHDNSAAAADDNPVHSDLAAPSAAGLAAAAGADLEIAMRTANGSGSSIADSAGHVIAVPVHDRMWPQAIAAQLLMLSDQKIQAATLRLSPEHLGPVEIRIDLQDSRVNVSFTAAHVETRAALEQSLPQLREVFAGAGLTLGQATIHQQTRRESQNSGYAPRSAPLAADIPAATVAAVRAPGTIDEYV